MRILAAAGQDRSKGGAGVREAAPPTPAKKPKHFFEIHQFTKKTHTHLDFPICVCLLLLLLPLPPFCFLSEDFVVAQACFFSPP